MKEYQYNDESSEDDLQGELTPRSIVPYSMPAHSVHAEHVYNRDMEDEFDLEEVIQEQLRDVIFHGFMPTTMLLNQLRAQQRPLDLFELLVEEVKDDYEMYELNIVQNLINLLCQLVPSVLFSGVAGAACEPKYLKILKVIEELQEHLLSVTYEDHSELLASCFRTQYNILLQDPTDTSRVVTLRARYKILLKLGARFTDMEHGQMQIYEQQLRGNTSSKDNYGVL